MPRIHMATVVGSFLLALAGCKSAPSPGSESLVGKWITTDITQVGHIPSYTVAMTMECKANGTFESFYIDKGGVRSPTMGEEPLQWTTKNNMLHIGDAPPIEYELSGSKLKLVLTDGEANKLTLHFTRQ